MARPKTGRKVALLAGFALLVVLTMVGTYWREIRWSYLLWRDFEGLGRNAQGYPEYRHPQTGIVFVGLPGGTFEMGSPESEEAHREAEGPVHEVSLGPFLIAKYEVTQAEWVRVMGDIPSRFEGAALPVEQISWEDCQEFFSKTQLSMPTEAQWEYACRAGTSGDYAGTGNLDDMGWYRNPVNFGRTHPVGEKQPNQFGLYDMHGNVWEWCLDWYRADFYSSTEASGRGPLCVSGSEYRVMRGGSWYYSAEYCRSAYRHCDRPSLRSDNLGFRPTWSLSR